MNTKLYGLQQYLKDRRNLYHYLGFELVEVSEHQWILGIERGYPVSDDEAFEDFIKKGYQDRFPKVYQHHIQPVETFFTENPHIDQRLTELCGIANKRLGDFATLIPPRTVHEILED